MSEWILTEDKLPEINERVLVAVGRTLVMAFRDGEHSWYSYHMRFTRNLKITHWMRIPPVPKELLRLPTQSPDRGITAGVAELKGRWLAGYEEDEQGVWDAEGDYPAAGK